MSHASIATFEKAIEATHGAQVEVLERRERIVETFEGETVWEGEVLTFKIAGHPQAERVYAWESDGRITAVLAVGPIDSPVRAVRAAILAEGEQG